MHASGGLAGVNSHVPFFRVNGNGAQEKIFTAFLGFRCIVRSFIFGAIQETVTIVIPSFAHFVAIGPVVNPVTAFSSGVIVVRWPRSCNFSVRIASISCVNTGILQYTIRNVPGLFTVRGIVVTRNESSL
jgi:hypothetical protein